MDVRELPLLSMVEELEPVHRVGTRLLMTRVRAGTTSARDARQGLTEQGLPLFQAQIGQREAYAQVWGTVIEDFGEYQYVLDELLAEVRV